MTRFGLLGPVVVDRGGDLVPVRWPMPRSVLAALLLDANRVVPAGRLVDVLWGDEPPASAVGSLHNHLMRLRAVLTGAGAGRIRTVAPGYLIEVADGEVDLDEFLGRYRRGRAALDAGDWDTAAGQLTAALGLWRGEPLADVTSPVLCAAEVPRLSQLRLDTVEARIDARLHLGRYPDAIAELRALTAAHPLRERFHAQLMLACYLSGRQAEALSVYRHARQVLAEELGVDPGAELQRLHQQILAGDPDVAAGPAVGRLVGTAWPPAAAAPMQLPPDTADFTGRDAQVRLLCDALAAPPDEARPGAVVICAVTGMGGVGKTALAVHAAHRLRDRFPDGQLFASLQGDSDPLRPAEVLARFLRDLGMPGSAIPPGEAERAARYRTLLAARSVLIVLDDARDAAQVRPLLPGTARCAVIVTSRGMLPGLTVVRLLGLGALDSHEAGALFRAIVGPRRAAAEPDATSSVLASCAGLPLAIRIAANRLASRPSWSIAHLAGKLADERARLTELTAGDLAVRASFTVSYDALPPGGPGGSGGPGRPDPARVFRLLGLPGAPVLSLSAITALAGQPAGNVAAALEILTDGHMLEVPAADRFRLHDLLRAYAAELAERTDSHGERKAAIGRMLRWYRDQAVIIGRVLAPGCRELAAVSPPSASPATLGPAQALDWFEAERAGLVAAVRQAAELGWHDIAAQIAAAMWGYYKRIPYDQDWLTVSQLGVAGARRLADGATLSWQLLGLAEVHSKLGQFADSRRLLTEALGIRRRAGDRVGVATVLNYLAVDLHRQDRFTESQDYLRRALDICTGLGEWPYAAVILKDTGENLLGLERHAEALEHLRQALAIWQETGHRYRAGFAEKGLGDAYLDLGRFQDAADHYRRALAAHDGITRDHPDQADILGSLGRALESLGRTREARDAWQAAIPILERNNDPRARQLRARLARSG